VDADPIVTVWVTHGRRAIAFRTPTSTRWTIDEVLKRGEYGLLRIPDWQPKTIVDVGSHAGIFALYCALHFPGARIHCYEPVARHAELARANLADFDSVTVSPFGLYHENGRRRIHYGRNNAGEASLFPGPEQLDEGEEVEVRSAKAVFDSAAIEHVDVLKIDTEGAELPILRDLGERLQHVDFLLLEYHSDDDRRAIDRMIADDFLLFGGRIAKPHVGTLKYARRAFLGRRFPRLSAPHA